MITDPIGDFLTRIRNAMSANHRIVEVPTSKIKKEITKVLHSMGYIQGYRFEDENVVQGSIKIALKYNPITKTSAIFGLERISKPGLRKYARADSLPRVMNGLIWMVRTAELRRL